jgi:hypothetical protein
MDTAKAALAMRMVAHGMRKLGVASPDYVSIGKVITEKLDAMPNASAKDIAITILENK